MPYLEKLFLIFSTASLFLAIMYWLYFKKSGEKFYFYLSVGSFLLAIFELIVIFNPDLRFKNPGSDIYATISIFPAWVIITAGFIWGNVVHPGLVKFISLRSLKQARNVEYRKDLLITAIISYAAATCYVVITNEFDLIPTTLILIGAVFAIFSPLDVATKYTKERHHINHSTVN